MMKFSLPGIIGLLLVFCLVTVHAQQVEANVRGGKKITTANYNNLYPKDRQLQEKKSSNDKKICRKDCKGSDDKKCVKKCLKKRRKEKKICENECEGSNNKNCVKKCLKKKKKKKKTKKPTNRPTMKTTKDPVESSSAPTITRSNPPTPSPTVMPTKAPATLLPISNQPTSDKLSDGSPCDEDNDCASGHCLPGHMGCQPKSNNGLKCEDDNDCLSGNCVITWVDNKIIFVIMDKNCQPKLKNGSVCQDDHHCSSGNCVITGPEGLLYDPNPYAYCEDKNQTVKDALLISSV